MIIVGAGALGLETLGILILNNFSGNIIFFDDNPKKTIFLYSISTKLLLKKKIC